MCRKFIFATLVWIVTLFVSQPLAQASRVTAASPMATAAACPFCSAVAATFTEQVNASDVAVLAKLLKVNPVPKGSDTDFPTANFEIVGVLNGKQFVKPGMTFATQLVGAHDVGTQFLVLGIQPPNVAWSTPMKSSKRVAKYLRDTRTLPAKGAKRLEFFQQFFEDDEVVLANDAFDEFARAPYQDLIDLKDKMDREKLIAWIQDPDTLTTHRALYYTMLGVCGTIEDTKMLETRMLADDYKMRSALDALIACYLTLKGESGVAVVEKTFLANKDCEYGDTLAAVSALRFHASENDKISKDRAVKAIRHLLDRPKVADMVIPDLARWEDWSVMEKLVQIFKEAEDGSNWVRIPVINYLRACPKPEAKTYLAELAKIDPEAVERANFFDSSADWGDDDDEVEPLEDDEDVKEKTPAKPLPDADGDSNSDQSESGSVSLGHVVRKVALPLIDGATTAFAGSEGSSETSLGDEALEQTQTIAVTTAADPGLVDSNTQRPQLVSVGNDPVVAQPGPVDSAAAVGPVATVSPGGNLTLPIIFVPMIVSVVIFLLLWSVVNGWFERLIF